MKVVEIFNSIEGEGKRAGYPCTFIRLFGCNLNCNYCDTQYACQEDAVYTVYGISEILSVVGRQNCKRVTVTGGEPLIHPGINRLLQALVIHGYEVNVETNGTIVPTFFHDNLFYTMDYKTGASGSTDKMNLDAFKELCPGDVLKFVVGSLEDMEQALEFVEAHPTLANIFVSPVYDELAPLHIVQFIQQHKLHDWRVQLQLHKCIWEPDKRGV